MWKGHRNWSKLRNKPQQSEEARQRRRPNCEYPESEKRPPWNRRQRSNKSKGKTEKTAEAKDVESKHKCGRCGYDKAHKKCPAMGQQCRHCKMQKDESFLETLFVKGSPSVTRGSRFRPGNRRRLWPRRKRRWLALFVYSVKSSCVPEYERFHEVIVLEDTEVRFQLDSGAKANVMSLTISGQDHRWQRRTLCWFPSLSTDWNLVEKWFRAPSTNW